METTMITIQQLHQEALARMQNYLQAVNSLLEIITRIDEQRAYLHLGYPSLWSYLTQGLQMAECHAHQFISVSRKAKEVPALQAAVAAGYLSLPKAALIVSEIKPANQNDWIEKAKTLPTRELREEIAKSNPVLAVATRITPKSEELSELRVGLSKETLAEIRRAQDLLSQKERRAVSIEETLKALARGFLEKHDKVKKAERALLTDKVKPAAKPIPAGRVARPAWIDHTVHLTSLGQCQARLPDGKRCTSQRFLEAHHRVPLSHGGSNAPENLILLCEGHHKIQHLKSPSPQPVTFYGQSRIAPKTQNKIFSFSPAQLRPGKATPLPVKHGR